MKRDQTPLTAPSRLLDLHGPGPNGLRHDAAGSPRAVGGDGPEQAAAVDAGAGAHAGRAQGVEAFVYPLTEAARFEEMDALRRECERQADEVCGVLGFKKGAQ